MKWQPKDIIAIVVILVAGALRFKGIDSYVSWTLIAVVCGYYGIDLTPIFKVGRIQRKNRGG